MPPFSVVNRMIVFAIKTAVQKQFEIAVFGMVWKYYLLRSIV